MPPKNMSREQIQTEQNIILKNALLIVAEEGHNNISMRKLAKMCKFSHTKIYYYFKNKDAILISLIEDGFSILNSSVVDECNKAKNEKERIIACLTQLYRFGIEKPNHFNLMFGIDSPKCSDFLEKDVSAEDAKKQREKAFEFYDYLMNIINDYASSVGAKLNDQERLNIFIQISGIVWLENSRILKELDHDKDSLFESTLTTVLQIIRSKST